jgi:O-antigen ligase
MPFDTLNYRLSTTRWTTALYLGGAISLLFLLYAAARGMEFEPFWIALAIPIAALLPVLVLRFPVILMVATVYVGTFKTHGATGVSMTDPTVLTVGLLYGAIILQVLLLASSTEGPRLGDAFAGQVGGVVASFLLVLVIAISYTYTPAPDIGRDKVLKLVAFDMPVFLAPLLLLRTDRDVRLLVRLCILASVVLAFRTVHRVLNPSAEMLLGVQDPTEIGEGLLMGAAALMALYYPFPEKRVFRAGLVLCIVALTVGTTASLSRSAILSLLLVATASLMFLRHNPGTLSRKAILITVAAVVVTVSVASVWMWHLPSTHAKFAEKAAELGLTSKGGYPPSGTAGQRYSFSESAWQAFLSKPLLGWGAGGWSTLWHYTDERVVKYPHNFILEIAAEQGLAGLAALAMLLLTMKGACATILHAPGSQFAFIVPVVALSLLGNAVTGQVETREMWLWSGTLFALARMAQLRRAGNPMPQRPDPVLPQQRNRMQPHTASFL